MRNGFYFKNKHSNDFGVTVQTQSRPIKYRHMTAHI